MDKILHVAVGVHLPLELAARTTAILAQKGAGKTYTAMRMAEEFLGHGQQIVAMDPTGVWWGLRAPAPEKGGRSFDVIVLGGEHSDAPLEPTAGGVVAQFAVDSGRSLILDMSGFESNAAQDRFATDLMETLYRAKARAEHQSTLHLIIDEADSFAPQRCMPGQQRMLGAAEAIVRRGRHRGLGITMISQRPAVLNKNVLSQADLLIALRVVGQHDHKALSEWAGLAGTKEQHDAFMASLPKLETGEAWFWSPGWLGIFQRGRVTKRVAFDSSRTPEPGQKTTAPKMATVNLETLSAEIAASVQRAKETDPRELKRRIADLERKLATEKAPALDATSQELFRGLRGEMLAGRDALIRAGEIYRSLSKRLGLPNEGAELRAWVAEAPSTAERPAPAAKAIADTSAFPARSSRPSPMPGAAANGANGAEPMKKADRSILTVLAQYAPAAVDKSRVALIAEYSSKGGGFNNALSRLRTAGFIEGTDPLTITREGLAAAGDVQPLPTGRELLEHWKRKLKKADREILHQLSIAPEHTLAKAALAVHCNYAEGGGGFNNALSRLRTLRLIDGKAKISLAEDLRP